MNMDILAILMVAFGLFSILLFILFYIYARTARNKRRDTDEFVQSDDDEDRIEVDNYHTIDKDSDNLVDLDIEKEDINAMNIPTNSVDDYQKDGSLKNGNQTIEEPYEEVIPHEEPVNVHKENDEFMPKKKDK